jgi:hypothetical protein
MELKLKSKKENLQNEFERILDVLSIALNRGLTESILRDLEKEDHIQRSHLWMYQKNGACSDFKNCDRVDLKPCMNDYWLNINFKSETEIIFVLTFRYSQNKEKYENIFAKMLLFLFRDCLESASLFN